MQIPLLFSLKVLLDFWEQNEVPRKQFRTVCRLKKRGNIFLSEILSHQQRGLQWHFSSIVSAPRHRNLYLLLTLLPHVPSWFTPSVMILTHGMSVFHHFQGSKGNVEWLPLLLKANFTHKISQQLQKSGLFIIYIYIFITFGTCIKPFSSLWPTSGRRGLIIPLTLFKFWWLN